MVTAQLNSTQLQLTSIFISLAKKKEGNKIKDGETAISSLSPSSSSCPPFCPPFAFAFAFAFAYLPLVDELTNPWQESQPE